MHNCWQTGRSNAVRLLFEPIMSNALGGRYGAWFAGNITRFSLWAPDAQQVDLLRPDAAPEPLQAQGDGWFSLELA